MDSEAGESGVGGAGRITMVRITVGVLVWTHACMCMRLLFKRSLSLSLTTVSLRAAADTDVIALHLAAVNSEVSKDGKQDRERGRFVERMEMVTFKIQILHTTSATQPKWGNRKTEYALFIHQILYFNENLIILFPGTLKRRSSQQ